MGHVWVEGDGTTLKTCATCGFMIMETPPADNDSMCLTVWIIALVTLAVVGCTAGGVIVLKSKAKRKKDTEIVVE